MEKDVERYIRENQVLREILRETHKRLEDKIHEFSLYRVVTDSVNRLVTQEDSLKHILAKMIEIIGAKNGSIMLLDSTRAQLELTAASGTKDLNPSRPSFPVGRGVAGWVAQQNKPLMIRDVNTDDKFFKSGRPADDIKALACLPLVFDEQTIGVMNVSSDRADAFDLNTERILHIIAGQVATAISNSKAMEEQKKKEKILEEKNRELMEMKKQLEETQEQLLKTQKLEAIKQLAISLHHEINNPLATIYSCTQLIEQHMATTETTERMKESMFQIKDSCDRIKQTVFKMANLQDVVLTDYIGDSKMIDIEKSYLEQKAGNSISPSNNDIN
jgi:transcriptional regulator with GAF, ATPase, and Fis domain